MLRELARVASRGGRPVRLLSAASAAGEEAYTLALVAREVLGPASPVLVTGVDVDEEALARARAAVYRRHALRALDDEARNRHFETADDKHWRLRPGSRAAAQFQHGNLVAPDWPDTLPEQDVVFCRNVLIYFDEPALRRAADNLYRVVRPGGYLFLGHAESLRRVPTRFVAERRPGAVFYRKPEG